MAYKYTLPAIAVLLFACTGLKPMQATTGQLSGYIYLLKGNQMPSPGRPVNKGRGVSRDIYVYEPATTSSTEGTSPLFTLIKTRLIAQTKSDSTGHYTLNLPAGKYSIFIKDGTKYFAAETDGNGILNPVEISKNTPLKRDFTLTAGAAY